MKKTTLKIIALCLAAALAVGGTAYAAGSGPETAPEEEKAPAPIASTADAAEKDETVYVLANADGATRKVIVSDWLKNAGSGAVTDRSELENIENVKGDETFTAQGDALTWDAAGNDIYYQGTADKPLPVSMKVSYTLDGKTVAPSELAGKSGRVTIRFDYTSNQSETVEINGQQEKIFVPFAMLTGVILDNDIFSNVSVTNGKLINDGDRTVIVGVALPGLQENLGISIEDLEIPDYVEIAADAENFALDMSVTVATNEVFNGLDTDSFGDLNSLGDALDKLTDGMKALLDGSSQLCNGLDTLLNKSGELSTGVDELAAGVGTLKDGAGSLNAGAAQLKSGAAKLSDGLDTLDSNSAALNAGAGQVFETLLAAANTQLSAAGVEVPTLTPENYARVLDSVIASIDESAAYAKAEAAVRQAVEAQRETIEKQVTEAVRAQVTAQVQAAMPGIAGDALTAAVDQQMAADEVRELIRANTEAQIDKLVDENMTSPEVQSRLAAAAEGVQTIVALKTSLDSYNTFYTGLQTYTAGVSQAAAGAAQLKSGAAELSSGTTQLSTGASRLNDGILTLKGSLPTLIDGVTALRDGAGDLHDGLTQFNEEGIKKLTELFDGDIDTLLARLRATRSVSQNYQAFAGIGDDMTGQVKFIYRTDSIG